MRTYSLITNGRPVDQGSTEVPLAPVSVRSATGVGRLVMQLDRDEQSSVTATIRVFGRNVGGQAQLLYTAVHGDFAAAPTLGNYPLTGSRFLAVDDIPAYHEMWAEVSNVSGGAGAEYIASTGVLQIGQDFPTTKIGAAVQDYHQIRVWYPPGRPPGGLWPAVLQINNSGQTSTTDFSGNVMSPASEYYQFMQSGIAVIEARLPFATAALAAADLGCLRSWRYADSVYGDNDANYFWDPNFPKVQKGLGFVVQWLNTYAKTRLNIDPAKILMSGRSGGAMAILLNLLLPDMADPNSEDPLLRASSVLHVGAVLNAGPFFTNVLSESISGLAFANSTQYSLTYPTSAGGAVASTLAQVAAGRQLVMSACYHGLQNEQCRQQLAKTPIYMNYSEGLTDVPFTTLAPTGDQLERWTHYGTGNAITVQHDAWHGYALWRYLRFLDEDYGGPFHLNKSRLALTDLTPLSTAPYPETDVHPDEATRIADQAQWACSLVGAKYSTAAPGPVLNVEYLTA
jgi:hypothetical protein